jgi:hypothetical protein
MTIIEYKEGLYTHYHFASKNTQHKLLIELPHGATKSEDFLWLQARLQGEYPEGLIDFFHVNTDVGSPEIAFAIANELQGKCDVHILQSHIPRTFIDCNRVVGEGVEYKAGGVTPATPPYVVDEHDLTLLHKAYDSYQNYAKGLYAKICGTHQGLALMLHTYAPRTVPITAIDQDIVGQLHAFYDTEKIQDCKLRSAVDMIYKTPSGEELSNRDWIQEMAKEFIEGGLEVANGNSYLLHPVTMAYHYAKMYPQQTLCLEIRRDLVVEKWEPFSEMKISEEKAKYFSSCVVRSLEKVYITK